MVVEALAARPLDGHPWNSDTFDPWDSAEPRLFNGDIYGGVSVQVVVKASEEKKRIVIEWSNHDTPVPSSLWRDGG